MTALRVLPMAYDSWNTGHDFPDVVAGRIFGGLIFLRVENRGKDMLHGVRLQVEGSLHLKATSGDSLHLQPGQRSSLIAPLVQHANAPVEDEACPLRVQLRLEADGVDAVHVKKTLLCRAVHDRFSFAYVDADGSPQMAAAKLPGSNEADDRGPECAASGCAVLLSTHGMDVTAQRQADCYRRKWNTWVLAPHGRGTHGFNWQGPGHWSAMHALEALAERAALWRPLDRPSNADTADGSPLRRPRVALALPRRVLFTGHSNGGFGAWLLGSHYPDMAVGVAPLSGMATMGTTEAKRPRGTPQKVSALARNATRDASPRCQPAMPTRDASPRPLASPELGPQPRPKAAAC